MGNNFRVRTKRGTTESLRPISNFSRTLISALDSRVHGPGDTCPGAVSEQTHRAGTMLFPSASLVALRPALSALPSRHGARCPWRSLPLLTSPLPLRCSALLAWACSLGRSLLLARRLSHQLPLPRPPAPQRRCLWQILATRLAEPLPVSGCQRPCHNGGDSGRRPNRTKTPGCVGRRRDQASTISGAYLVRSGAPMPARGHALLAVCARPRAPMPIVRPGAPNGL